MTLRVALIGTIAQNATLLAYGLRRLGVDADSYDQGGGFPMQMPHWQWANFDPLRYGLTGDTDYWDWAQVSRDTGWQRPFWAKILGNDGADPWYDTQEAFQGDLARVFRGQKVLPAEDKQRADLQRAIAGSRTPPESHGAVLEAAMKLGEWRSVLAVAKEYDLVVLCGQYAAFGPLLPAAQPYIAFEHATMRYVPGLATPAHRLIALAYRQSDANVITNADCWEAAGMLGVREKSVFIPHPLDEQQFTPGDHKEVSKHKARVCAQLGCELVFLAPARHSRSEATGSKRNDRILYAYARYVQEAEPAGAPRAALVLAAWGHPEHVRESEALVAVLGLQGRVCWLPCLPKPRLLKWYRLADVVLDQFSETVGSFGAVTAEAMACGRPVITYYSGEAHTWCQDVLPEHPMLASARTTEHIYRKLLDFARDADLRVYYGLHASRWIERHHSLERVCTLHKALYEKVLAQRQKACTTIRVTALAPGVEVQTDPGVVVIEAMA